MLPSLTITMLPSLTITMLPAAGTHPSGCTYYGCTYYGCTYYGYTYYGSYAPERLATVVDHTAPFSFNNSWCVIK